LFDLEYKTMANRLASLVQVDIDKLSVTKKSWGQQFREAMNVNGGDLDTAKIGDYVGHCLAFFWKVIFNKFKFIIVRFLIRSFLLLYHHRQ
jgi:solute carrier family 8 (sodium/calcium exchanger)